MATNLMTPGLKSSSLNEDNVKLLSVRRLMWLRFTRNRLAVTGAVFLIVMYLVAIFAGFLAPYSAKTIMAKYTNASPTLLRFIDAEGKFHFRPFVYELESSVDPATFKRTFKPNVEKKHFIRFFAKGDEYSILGIKSNIHFMTVAEPAVFFVLGTDKQGKDLFSRILYGSQVSLTVGLVGVFLSLILGTFMGVLAGYYGGWVDNLVQRLIEVLLSFPQLPLWIALAAVVPPNWSSVKVYFGITIVLSIVDWGGLARQVRGKVLSLREQDYVRAAQYSNSGSFRIITRHLMPNTLSHVLVVATLSVPGMILGESALSFLGLGIKPPMTSWGLLLSEAQTTRVLLQQPWILTPIIFIVTTVIAFNFVGDGLRDAADPFA